MFQIDENPYIIFQTKCLKCEGKGNGKILYLFYNRFSLTSFALFTIGMRAHAYVKWIKYCVVIPVNHLVPISIICL